MFDDGLLRSAVQSYCMSISKSRLLVQAAGGNVSWKFGSTLWIKASGTWLADAGEKDIFVPVDRKPVNAALAGGDYSLTPKALDGYSLRPSIETILHALMPHTFVVHLHPVEAVVHLLKPDSQRELESNIGNALRWGLVGYHKPGFELARAVHKLLLASPDLQVVFLQNHGLILGADTLEEIDANLRIIIERLSRRPRVLDGNNHYGLEKICLEGLPYQACQDFNLHKLATDAELYQGLQNNWAICPDHVVFLGAKAICMDALDCEAIRAADIDSAPPFVFIKNLCVLEKKTVTAAERAQLKFYLDVISRLGPKSRLELLQPEQIASLLNWDAEKYRRVLNQTLVAQA